MSGELVEVYGQSDYTELPDEKGPLSLFTRTWQWIQWVFLSMLTYATVYLLKIDRQQLRRTAKGVRRSVRHTFRKIFGLRRKRRSQYEANTKFITDKMLSESSSEGSDAETTAFQFSAGASYQRVE